MLQIPASGALDAHGAAGTDGDVEDPGEIQVIPVILAAVFIDHLDIPELHVVPGGEGEEDGFARAEHLIGAQLILIDPITCMGRAQVNISNSPAGAILQVKVLPMRYLPALPP